MPITTTDQAPLLVKNPQTDKHINITPLFTAFEESGESGPPSPERMSRMVELIIRRVNLNWDGDSIDQKNVNTDLYILLDMFKAMTSF